MKLVNVLIVCMAAMAVASDSLTSSFQVDSKVGVKRQPTHRTAPRHVLQRLKKKLPTGVEQDLPTAPAVVDGTPVADEYVYPYYVRLSMGCGGALIHPKLVMTAAHCTFGKLPSSISLWGGSVQAAGPSFISAPDGVTTYQVKSIFNHPNYDFNTLENDISILLLEEPATFTTDFAVPSTIIPPPGTNISIMGFGDEVPGGSQQEFMLEATNQVLSDSDCGTCCDYNTDDIIDDAMICLDALDGSPQDTCQGDSGGPAVLASDPMQVVGIVSWGIGCGSNPGVYTQVSSYVDFVETYLNYFNNPCGQDVDLNLLLKDSYLDGWSGNALKIQDCSGNPIGSWELIDGGEQLIQTCIDGNNPYVVYFDTSEGTYPYEPSATFVNNNLDSLTTVRASDGVVIVNGDCPAGSIIPDIPPPSVYTPSRPPACGPNTFYLGDSYGDGWQGATVGVYDCLGNGGQFELDDSYFSDTCYPLNPSGFTMELDLSTEDFYDEPYVVITDDSFDETILSYVSTSYCTCADPTACDPSTEPPESPTPEPPVPTNIPVPTEVPPPEPPTQPPTLVDEIIERITCVVEAVQFFGGFLFGRRG